MKKGLYPRDLVALIIFSFGCLVTLDGLLHFLTVPLVSLYYMIVALPYNIHFFHKLVKNV